MSKKTVKAPLRFGLSQGVVAPGVQATFDLLWGVEEPHRLALFTPDQIFEAANQELLEKLREDKRLERKPSGFFGPPLAEYLSMWANTAPDGGLMAMGVNDDGSFQGCGRLHQDRLNALEALQELCPNCRCVTKRIPIKVEGKEDFVVLVRVPYVKDRVVKTPQGMVWIRRGDKKKRLSPEETRELATDKGEIDFEREPCPELTYPEDFDREAIREFAESVRSSLGIQTWASDEEILGVRHLGERSQEGGFVPNIACALLFAREIDRILPGCKIRFFRFDGDQEGSGEKFNAVKDVWIESKTVPELIHAADGVIASQVRTFSSLGADGKFYTMPEYPKHAWYEALVNACVHRSYGNGLRNMTITVKMFDNRLVIESPGPFPPFVTPENIYGMSHPRNPKLMMAMYFLKFVKMASEGTRRMRDTMKAMNLPEPEFSQKEIGYSLVRVTLRNNIRERREWVDVDAVAIVGAAIASTLSDKETRVLNFAAEHGRINVTQAVRLTEVSWETAKKMLDDLAVRRILEHVHRPDLERDPKAHYRLGGKRRN